MILFVVNQRKEKLDTNINAIFGGCYQEGKHLRVASRKDIRSTHGTDF